MLHDGPKVGSNVKFPQLVRTGKVCGSYAGSLAVLGATYVGVEQSLEMLRKKKDIINGAVAGFAAGATLGFRVQVNTKSLEIRHYKKYDAAKKVRGGGAVRGARGQVEKEPPDSASNRIQKTQRDTIVKWEVDCAKIDPNELQSMEEKAVRKLVEKIGETVLWGPEQEARGLGKLRAEFFVELVDLNIDSKVGYVPSHLAMQKVDDDWASQRHIVPIITDLTLIADGANAHAEEGNVAVVDWNAVELEEPTNLVIAPIADTEMAKLFGIPVDDRDEEERDEANTSDNDDTELSEDVDEQLMKDAADDVDDAHDEELVHVYDKENPVIRVGKLWPNMDEFRLSFKTYAVRHQFDAKTIWTDRNKFYAKCRGFDGSGRMACKWRKLPSQPIVVEQCWPTKRARVSGSRRKTSQWLEQFGVATEETDVRVHTIETEAVVTEEMMSGAHCQN
ncbi:outer envelope pore protein 16-3, chloroplastic/mitochondrial-like [Hordeum vulgare]|nr:outer envelope pore protein 16-3, chloroplastic/mitochondrial-like [Hordeum vulgare]